MPRVEFENDINRHIENGESSLPNNVLFRYYRKSGILIKRLVRQQDNKIRDICASQLLTNSPMS
jgi:hypothetical protein